MFAHIVGCHNVVCRGLDEHVPAEVRVARARDVVLDATELRQRLRLALRRAVRPGRRSPRVEPRHPPPLAGVPLRDKLTMIYRLGRSQLPSHSPVTDETRAFADEWIRAYDEGRDVVHWYSPTP